MLQREGDMMAKQDDYVRYTIRVPANLYAQIQAAAGEKSVNAEIVERLAESIARDRWLNDLSANGPEQDEEDAAVRRRYDISPNPSGQFVAPEGVSEEQLSRFIADELKKANLVAIERIAAGLRKVGGNYIPFDPEGDDTTKE